MQLNRRGIGSARRGKWHRSLVAVCVIAQASGLIGHAYSWRCFSGDNGRRSDRPYGCLGREGRWRPHIWLLSAYLTVLLCKSVSDRKVHRSLGDNLRGFRPKSSTQRSDIALSEIVILVHYADLGIRIGVLNLGDDRSFCFEIGIKRHGQRAGFRIMYRARAARAEFDRIANHGCDLSLVSRDC